jgi:hypothetical protein
MLQRNVVTYNWITLSRFAIFKGPHMCPSDIERPEDIESSGRNESHRVNNGQWHPQSKWGRPVIKRTNEKWGTYNYRRQPASHSRKNQLLGDLLVQGISLSCWQSGIWGGCGNVSPQGRNRTGEYHLFALMSFDGITDVARSLYVDGPHLLRWKVVNVRRASMNHVATTANSGVHIFRVPDIPSYNFYIVRKEAPLFNRAY